MSTAKHCKHCKNCKHWKPQKDGNEQYFTHDDGILLVTTGFFVGKVRSPVWVVLCRKRTIRQQFAGEGGLQARCNPILRFGHLVHEMHWLKTTK